jgi:hypothetical protein
VLLPLASASSAWSDFVSYSAPVAVPKDSVDGLNLAQYETTNQFYHLNSGAYVQPVSLCPTSGTPDSQCRAFTVNNFIKGSTTNAADIKNRIAELCKAGALGTDFGSMYTTDAKFDGDNMPSQCLTCLAKGFGTSEATPGFYLPCGCQATCVDVSGNTTANFNRAGLAGSSLAPAANSAPTQGAGFHPWDSMNYPSDPTAAKTKMMDQYRKGIALKTCQDYKTNKIVLTCNQVSIYHFVLWPSLLGGAALIYFAMYMGSMQLDMDSLLYTVGSSSKKDN